MERKDVLIKSKHEPEDRTMHGWMSDDALNDSYCSIKQKIG